MTRSLILIALASTVVACQTPVNQDNPARGVEAVNVPVVTRADYALDLNAQGGSLPSSEAARLDGWFRSMNLGYGDTVYVDGDASGEARTAIARVAGQYGLLVASGAPSTAGAVAPGMVRVVVSRTEASVPNCPNWSRPGNPTADHVIMSNYACAINGNLAAMIANPQDLVHGREGSGVVDNVTAIRGVEVYRKATPTGSGALKDISTKGN